MAAKTATPASPWRARLIEIIEPNLPKGWAFEPYLAPTGDNLAVPTVFVVLKSISRNAQTPRLRWDVDYTVTVFSPTAPDTADQNLDGNILDLLTLLDGQPDLLWSNANQVNTGDGKYLGYDIAVTLNALLSTTN